MRTQVDRVDGLTTSIAVKAAVTCATTANITLSGLQTIDGVLVVGDDIYPPDRVLVKDQTDTTTNGIYNPTVNAWTRALDFDGSRDITDGTLVWVRSGDTNQGMWKTICADRTVVVDTSAMTFLRAITGSTVTVGTVTVSAADIFEISHERDGGGSAITSGESGDEFCAWPFVILGWVIQADVSGSIQFDVWAKAYADDSPPTMADTITASAKPLMSSHQQKKSTTLTGWTTSFSNGAAGTSIRYKVDSASTITRYKLTLICRRI